MRTLSGTVKELREQLASDDDMLREKMSDLVSFRKIVGDAEIERRARSRRSRVLAENAVTAPQL
jgi:hypothetical protein